VRVFVALMVSVLLHGMLFWAASWLVLSEDGPMVQAEIDLSSVEFSIAKEDDADAKANPMMPTEAQRPPRPREEDPQFEEIKSEPLPPDMASPKVPEPKLDSQQIEEFVPQSAPAPANAPRQARVDAPPRPKKSIRPYYPPESRQRGEQGEVVLEIDVGADGLVEDVAVVESSGYRSLDEAAMSAARSAKFVPAKSGDRNVSSVARLKLAFKLK